MKIVLTTPRIADADLFLLIRKGEKQGAEILYDTYANLLFLTITRIVPQREIAEQVLQETFKKIWYSIDDYAFENKRIFTWMIIIAKTTALEALTLSKSAHENKIESF